MVTMVYTPEDDTLKELVTNSIVPREYPSFEIFKAMYKVMVHFEFVSITRIFGENQHYKISKRPSCNQYIVEITNL